MDIILNLLPHLLNGLALGLLFALIALGFMLIVGVMELINLAHGSLFALGAYVAMTIIDPNLSGYGAFGEWYMGLSLTLRYIIALAFAPVIVAFVGMGLEICMRRTYGKKAEYGLLLTYGAALVLEETIRITWGSAEQVLQIPDAISGAFIAGGMIYSNYRFFAAGFGLVLILVVWLFLEKTPYGSIIKAGAGTWREPDPLAPVGLWPGRGSVGHCGRGADTDLGPASACGCGRRDPGILDHCPGWHW